MNDFATDRGQTDPMPLDDHLIIQQVREHAIFLLDLQGRISSWNEGVGALFGYEERDWTGRPLRDVFTPQDQEIGVPEAELRKALDTGIADDDRWLRRHDGSRFFASGALTRIADEDGTPIGFIKVVRDNTGPLRALEERERLLESEQTARADAERQAAALTAAIEAIPDGVYIGDLNGIVRCNRPALDMLGAKSVDELNAPPADLARQFRIRRELDGDLVQIDELPYARALKGEVTVVETWATNKATGEDLFIRGTAAPIVVDGKTVGVVAVNSNLTPRLALEAKQHELDLVESVLRERDEQLRAVFAGVRDYAIFTVGIDGNIASWHEGAALMKGYTAEEAIGMPFATLFRQEDRDAGRPQFEMDVAARTGEYKGEGSRRRANGSHFDAAVVLTALRGPQGQLLGFLKLTQDISERRRVEREREDVLRNVEAARVEAERINHAMGEFLATISHELRTPLGAILGWAQVLDRQPSDAATVTHALEAITRNARAQVQLIEDLLDMSRIESGQLRLDMRPIEVGIVVTKAIDAILPAATAKGIRLDAVVGGVAVVSADPDRLQQVVWNLVSNAVKFTPNGGQVTLGVVVGVDDVKLSVSDTGEGIEPTFLLRMFDRFQQQDGSTTRRHGGLGLGLSIARQLTELHGGNLQGESAGLGKGSTFTVSLPLLTGSPPVQPRLLPNQQDHVPLAVEPFRLKDVSVLLIDDEADSLEVAAYALHHAGANVITAANALDGMVALRNKRPTVVVCDIGMPAHDGYEFIRWLRRLPPEQGGLTPAAAFTAFARAEDKERAVREGYHAHLSKPAEPADLIDMVANLAKNRR